MMETIKRTYLAEAVAQRLLTMIEDGELRPGGKLPPESHLCTMLGVSRTAIREGVRALAGINVLGVFPGRGTFVNENPDIMVNNNALNVALGRETFKSLYEARYALDLGIAKFAVLNGGVDDIQALQEAIGKMEESLKPGSVNITRATEADEEFHLAFYKAAHNKILESIAGPIITHTLNRTWKRQKKFPKYFRVGVTGHKKILEAVKKRNIRLTMQAIEDHLEVVFKGVGGN